MTRWFLLLAMTFGLAACGSNPGERALTGGAIGAGAGAVVGSAVPGIGWAPGAIVGGLGGAAIGIVTSPMAW